MSESNTAPLPIIYNIAQTVDLASFQKDLLNLLLEQYWKSLVFY
ncbi:MAG: hypothetical protein AAF849_19595 [Bacteroidota bacterium]